MKKILFILLFPLTLFGQSQKISDMTSATSLTGSEYVPIVQTTNKKSTVTLLRGWASTIGTAGQLLKVNAGATALEFFTPAYLTSVGTGVTNELTYWSGTNTLGSLATATYPSLTELSYVKGLTSSAQTQLGTKWGLSGTSTLTGNTSIQGSGSGYDLTIGDVSELGNFSLSAAGAINLYRSNSQLSLSTSTGALRNATRVFYVTPGSIEIDYESTKGLKFETAGTTLNIGSDATGDTYYRNSSGYLTRLAAGTNGHVLTLAAGIPSWAAPSGGSGLTVGTSTITSGTNTRVLYNNAGTLGEYTISGSGNVAMTTSPTFTTPNIGTATGTASGNWSLTNGGTLLGNNTITQAGYNTTFSGIGTVTFSPTSGYAGINVGGVATNPTTVANGNFWYNTTDAYLAAHISGNPRMLLSQSVTGSTNNTIPYFTTGSRGVVSASTSFSFDGTGLKVGAGTITANTRLNIIGIGTGTNNALMVEDSGGTDRFSILDNGKINIITAPTNDDYESQVLVRDASSGEVQYRNSSSIGSIYQYLEGSVSTSETITVLDGSQLDNGESAFVKVTVVATQSSGTVGATAYGFIVKGMFRKSGGSLTQVGSSVQENVFNDTGDSFTGTPGLSVSAGAVVYSVVMSTSKTFDYKYTVEIYKNEI